MLSEAEWAANESKWLPTAEDRTYVTSLMGPAVIEPGKYANWISAPTRGINNQPGNFEYVRFN
jgi:benzoyl-CoA 2,3-dioxygenase component B